MVPILILGTLCFTFLGMTISNFAQRETQVSLLCNIIGMPMTFCSNAFYSLNGAPGWLKVLSNILPLNHLIEGIHAALDGNAAGIFFLTMILPPNTTLFPYTTLFR